MPEKETDLTWLAVIGRSLAYLSLTKAVETKPGDFTSVLDKVKFLTDLGLPEADAAFFAGSNLQSVRVMKSQKKGASRGRKK